MSWLEEIRRSELLKRHGHYEIAFGSRSHAKMRSHAEDMERLEVKTRPISPEQLEPLQRAANMATAAGLYFEDTANVIDPLEAVRAFAAAALKRNARFRQMDVKGLHPRGNHIQILGGDTPLVVGAAVICAGVHSAPLLAPFGLRAAAGRARLPRRDSRAPRIPRRAAGL